MDDEIEDPQITDDTKPKGNLLGLILTVLGITVLGAGAGGFFAIKQVDTIATLATKKANEAPVKDENALAWNETSAVAQIDPVLANLASPQNIWIRLDTAMVFDRDAVEDVERMKAVLGESVLAFLRTVSLSDLQGASAFNHLRDDLNERARIASSGTVKELIIETMVLQ
ncbi:flagellar basal body-associated FliL family protein [Acuticoccus sp. M5D2P5]|uniref:flagellar basal body-associated FliL family protein n=1 Tax=Acuticoccus kalidii TaxID=2910977 RepID=UPI001F44A217|nr:flagellar basal body-associated FliL family protein [Acuticoccus kalidii]MCF3932466.1 flagellar basal body-associated FliL family protein [Acuticoccus kalidii]